MKKILLIILVFIGFNATAANSYETDLILQEIATLRADMNKRFEQVDKRFEQVDRRFEQVDRRFEQVDRRFESIDTRLDFMQNILYILMGLVFASPFIAIHLRDKREEHDRQYFDNIKAVLFVLRELAQSDEKITKALRSAGLL